MTGRYSRGVWTFRFFIAAFVGQVTAVFEKNFAVSTSSGLLKNGVCVTRANCKSGGDEFRF